MGVVVDTGVLILLERAREREAATAALEHIGQFTSSITLSELILGAELADTESRRDRRLRFLDHVRQKLQILDFTAVTAPIHARLHARLRRSGQIIGAHDLIIAATALEHDHSVLTTNQREFERVQGLTVIAFPPTTI